MLVVEKGPQGAWAGGRKGEGLGAGRDAPLPPAGGRTDQAVSQERKAFEPAHADGSSKEMLGGVPSTATSYLSRKP